MPIKKGTVEIEKIYRADYNYLRDYLNWNGGTTTKSELLSSLEWEFSSSKGSIYNALNWDGAIPSDLPEVERIDYKSNQIFPTQYTVTFKTGWDGSTISTQTINKGSNAVFPSVSYGTGYQSNGYSGSYTNIQSDTTITINRKPIEYTLTIGSKTGVTGVTVKRGSTTLSNGATIYHHESLTITASASTGYNNPTVTSPITVTGNINTNNYITTGSIKTYTLTIGSKTGVTGITVTRNGTTLSNGATINHFDTLTITASAATGYNNPTVTSPVYVTGNINTNNYITAGSIKTYTLTIGSKTGVKDVTVKRGSTTLSNGATIYHHESLTITASASTGYNNPTVTSPITVSGNVNTNNYITAGSIKTYTLTIGTPPTGVSSITVKRGSTTLSDGATISHFDSLVITASAATGYNNPTVTSPITVSGNVYTNNYVSAGTRKSYTLTKGTPPAGVSSITVTRNGTTLSNGATILHFDSLVITATAATGYNDPSVISPVSVTGNITDTNYVYAGTRKSYTVTFKTQWNNQTVSTQSVYHGDNATFPTVNYGTGYEYDYHSGTYTNVTSNRTITIYRKSTTPKTADPTVGTPYCRAEENQLGGLDNNIKVNITNNDTVAVTVYINGYSSGTLAAGATGTYQVAGRVNVPYGYGILVYTQATGKTPSQTIQRTGTIIFCQLM